MHCSNLAADALHKQSRTIVIAMPVEIEQLQGIKPGTRVVAAMSGGVDSPSPPHCFRRRAVRSSGMMQLYPKDLPLAEPAEGAAVP